MAPSSEVFTVIPVDRNSSTTSSTGVAVAGSGTMTGADASVFVSFFCDVETVVEGGAYTGGWAVEEEGAVAGLASVIPPKASADSNSKPSVGTSVIPNIAHPKQQRTIPACGGQWD